MISAFKEMTVWKGGHHPTWRASGVWRPTWHTWGLGRAWTCPEGWCQSMWYFKHNAQPTVWWLICHSEWSTMNAFINRNSLILGAFMSDHWYSHRFHSLMSNLKTLGSLMMFPGTMTRPPPPFTSTITRLSSRSLSCQVVRCKWSPFFQTCRHSLIRWPNFRSMFRRWSCCQEFPENFHENSSLIIDGNTWRLKGDLKLLPKDCGFLFRRFAWRSEWG